MATIASLMVKINGDVSGLTSALSDAEKQLSSIGSRFTSAGKSLSLGLTLPIVGFGASIVKTGMEFEAQMSRVQAIAEATAEELAAMKNQALELGASTSKSASEVAKGFEEMAAMGFEVNEVMAAMPGVIAASEASGADMAQVAAVMSSTLNAFAMDASQAAHVADVLSKTANISAANITDMQYALKFAAGPAAALGISLEQLSAAVGIMVDRGATGEQAGTTLRSALLSLVDPSKTSAEAMAALGVTVLDEKKNFRGMSNIIKDLKKSMDGMTGAQQAARISQIFGTEATTGMLNIIQAGPDVFDEMTAALENSTGSAAEAAAIMKDNLAGSFDNLTGAVETASIKLYDMNSGPLRAVVDKLTEVVNAFSSLPPNVQQSIVLVAAALATLGPGLMMLGMMVQGLGALAGAFAIITSPVGLVVLAIAGLVAALVYLYNTNETARNMMISAWTQIQSFLVTAWNAIKAVAMTVWNGLLSFWQMHGATITAYFMGIWTSIQTLLVGVWTFISTLAMTIFAGLLLFWQENGAGIMEVFGMIWNTILTILTDASAFIAETLAYISAQWNTVFPGLSESLGKVFNFILHGILKPILNNVVATFKWAWPLVEWIVMGTWESIKRLIKGAIDIIFGLIKTFSGVLTGDWKMVWEGIKQTLSGALNAIWSIIELWGVGKLLKFFKYVGSEAGAIFRKLGTEIADAFKDMMKWVADIWNRLPDTVKAPVRMVIDIINKMINAINKIQIKIPEVDIPLVGKVGGGSVGFSIPNIPALETGTNYVPKDGLHYLHEGEAVVPKKYNPQSSGNGNGQTVVNVFLDGKLIDSYVDSGMGARLNALGVG